MDVVSLTPNFALHGNYVGPGHTGGKKLGDVNWKTKPIDDLDKAARVHDWHYTKHSKNRGAADAVLARAAFKAIKTVPGLSAKAKAAFVAAGMGAMSVIGSRDGTKLTDPPEYGAVNGMKQQALQPVGVVPAPALVGIEKNPGPKPEVAVRNGKMVNQRKPKPKQQPQPKQQKKQNQPKQSSTSTGFIPTTMNPVIDKTPHLKPVYDTGNVRVKIMVVSTPATIIATGQILLNILIDRAFFASTSLAKFFDVYENWELFFIEPEMVATEGTSVNGNVYVLTEKDPADYLIQGTVQSVGYFSGHNSCREHSLYGKYGVRLQNKGKDRRQLFSDAATMVTASNTTVPTNDERFNSAGCLIIAASDGMTLTSTQIGALWANCRIRFSNPGLNENASVFACIKSAAYTGNSIYAPGGATSFNVAQILDVATANATSAYYEANFQPDVTAGSSIQIPPGDWYLKAAVYTSSAPGNSTWTIAVTGTPTYSFDPVLQNSTLNPPEWAVGPTSSVAIGANGNIIAGHIRIDTPSAGNPKYALLTLSYVTANTVACNGIVFYLARMPSVVSAPFLSHYPKGNSGSAVDFRVSGTVEAGERYVPKPVSTQSISVSTAEILEFAQLRKLRDQLITLGASSSSSSQLEQLLSSSGSSSLLSSSSSSSSSSKDEVKGDERSETPVMLENPLTHSTHIHPDYARSLAKAAFRAGVSFVAGS